MTRGAVAAGSPSAARIGLQTLQMGGNAVDAAVAAMLAACTAEPMLTGLAGAGVATMKIGGVTRVFDMFTDMPGRGRDPARPAPELVPVNIDFGPTTQQFLVGPGSIAVPALGIGLVRLHQEYGRLPLDTIVEPAAALAEGGVEIRPGMARILELIWPICRRDPDLAARIGVDNQRALRAGERYQNPDLARTLRRLGRQGAELLVSGDVADAMLRSAGPSSLLTAEDLRAYRPMLREPLRYRFRDATVWVPGPPSVAGLLVLQALREIEDHGLVDSTGGPDQVRLIAAAMARTEAARRGKLGEALFTPGFVDGFMTAIAADEEGEEWLSAPMPDTDLNGHTTHISVADEDGNTIGITASLGEGAGIVADGTGITMNNLLGEADVNPPGISRPPGHRLLTMCCPTIVEIDDGPTYTFGSGGSSRIRSAILHAIIYAAEHRRTPSELVLAPRLHFEDGQLNLELAGRPEGTLESTQAMFLDVRPFKNPDMFFGGLNIVGQVGDGSFTGAADPRRSGTFRTTG